MQSPLKNKENNDASKIKILVCTANMGNAEPDLDSLNAWIPRDGDTRPVLEDQPYPIRFNVKEKFKNAVKKVITETAQNGVLEVTRISVNDTDNDEGVAHGEKFDIIAIGMQEATFEVTTGSKQTTIARNVRKITQQMTDLTGCSDYQKSKKNIAVTGIQKISTFVRGETVTRTKTSSLEDEVSADSFSICDPDSNSLHISDTKAIEANKCEELDTRILQQKFHGVDTQMLHQTFQEHLPSYTRAVSYQRGQMRLMIFYNENKISLDVLSVQGQNTGLAGLANKGGIAAECNINNGTRIAFLSAHLEAHEGESKYKTRCSTVGDIFRGTRSTVPDFHCDASLASHYTFFVGDLNFRTRLPGFEPGSQEHINETNKLVQAKDWNTINEHDELSMAIRNNDCFTQFQTLKCIFPCTFKVHRVDGYIYNDKRSPSYTDRILYHANHLMSDGIMPLAYEPIDHFTSSDHKPIRGAFEVRLNTTLRWRPILVKDYQSFRSRAQKGKALRGASHGKRDGPSPTKREKMRVLVSSIECNISSQKYAGAEHEPSTYVSFVSTPRNVMKKDVSNGEKLRRILRLFKSKRLGDKNKAEVQLGWPRTRTARKSCRPHWQEKVCFKIRTHDSSGTSMDLTGALLHVILFDAENFSVIGSFTLNLAFLIERSRKQMSKSLSQSLLRKVSSQRRTRNFRNIVMAGVRNMLAGRGSVEDETNQDPSNYEQCDRDLYYRSQSNSGKQDPSLRDAASEAFVMRNGAETSYDSDEHDILRMCSSEEQELSADLEINGHSPALRRAFRFHMFASRTSKTTQVAMKRTANSELGSSASSDNPDVRTLKFDNEPLMKDGRLVGRISFTIAAWWVDSSQSSEGQAFSKQTNREFPSCDHKPDDEQLPN